MIRHLTLVMMQRHIVGMELKKRTCVRRALYHQGDNDATNGKFEWCLKVVLLKF